MNGNEPPQVNPARNGEQPREIHVIRRLNCDARISHGAVHLWHYLYNRRNRDSECWPTQSQIARDLHCDEHRVSKWIKILKDCLYLFTKPIGCRHNFKYTFGNGDEQSYQNLPEWVDKAADTRQARTVRSTGATQDSRALRTNGAETPPRRANESAAPVVCSRRTVRTTGISLGNKVCGTKGGGNNPPIADAEQGGKTPKLTPDQMALKLKDKERLVKNLKEERLSVNPDRELIEAFKSQIAEINDIFKQQSNPTKAATVHVSHEGRNAGTANDNADYGDIHEKLGPPNPRNRGVIVGPTDYSTAKPRFQRERDQKAASQPDTTAQVTPEEKPQIKKWWDLSEAQRQEHFQKLRLVASTPETTQPDQPPTP